MLRCMQSSSMENFNGESTTTDMSVLERQRVMLQRLLQYQQQQQQLLQHCPQAVPSNVNSQSIMPASQIMVNQNSMLVKENNLNWPVKMDHCFDENLQNFPVYGGDQFGFASSETNCRSFTTISNSSLTTTTRVENQGATMAHKENMMSTKKRKAEFEAEEECKDERFEGETGEAQSEITVKSETENSKGNSKPSEVKKPDYIHVRARRGQATDNHSLAERARREKISKKMRCLQDLVPGCNKVTGKAGMLDEIINYVQSLQKQVEFLSMKLGALNPRLDFNVDNLFAKELPAYIASFPTPTTPLDMANSNYFQVNPLQQGATSCGVDIVANGTQMMPQRRDFSSISTPEVYLDSSFVPQVQQLPTWDTDWQNLYNVNFH